jgi:hypothetical protein
MVAVRAEVRTEVMAEEEKEVAAMGASSTEIHLRIERAQEGLQTS